MPMYVHRFAKQEAPSIINRYNVIRIPIAHLQSTAANKLKKLGYNINHGILLFLHCILTRQNDKLTANGEPLLIKRNV